MNKIAVLIPCYNESLTIKTVIEDFQTHIPQADIYVYDNNSTDNTAEIAKNAGAIVVHEYRQGKGNVVRSMFRDIDADCYIMVDGDNTYPAKDAYEVAKLILENKADMAIGDRLSSTYYSENKRPFHNIGNKLVKKLINNIFKSDVKDIMTGCRAFNKKFVKSFPVLSKGFEIETEMSIHALDKGFLIKEIPIAYRDRPEGSHSKLNTIKDGIKVLKTIFNLFKDFKPLAFFSLISFIFFSIGILLFVPIFSEFLVTGLVPKIPTLLVSIGLMICSLLSITCGLILDTVKKHSNQFFELALNIICLNEKNLRR